MQEAKDRQENEMKELGMTNKPQVVQQTIAPIKEEHSRVKNMKPFIKQIVFDIK